MSEMLLGIRRLRANLIRDGVEPPYQREVSQREMDLLMMDPDIRKTARIDRVSEIAVYGITFRVRGT